MFKFHIVKLYVVHYLPVYCSIYCPGDIRQLLGLLDTSTLYSAARNNFYVISFST